MSRNFFIHVRIIFGGNFPGVISGSFFLRQTRCKGLAEELLPLGRRGLLPVLFQFRYEAEIFTNIVCHFTKISLNLRSI